MFGIIGSGSWATALVKILTDNGHTVNWWVRNPTAVAHIKKFGNNPTYLSSVKFNTNLLNIATEAKAVIEHSEMPIIAVPSAFVEESLANLKPEDVEGRKFISAVKGLHPEKNILLNYFLEQQLHIPIENYFAVLGPCHAEEVAGEKLSYLTFSGVDTKKAEEIAAHFKTSYINTVVNHDILGVQYAAVMKNIYALGAGIASGLGYGDNFLSVYIANAADEMAGFLKKFGAKHITVGEHIGVDKDTHRKLPNYAASVYLGDLLVTCYSLYSRNRSFGKMIGQGVSVQQAKAELNMVAEGYNASKCIFNVNQSVQADVPISETVYRILWEQVSPEEGFKKIEEVLI